VDVGAKLAWDGIGAIGVPHPTGDHLGVGMTMP